MAKKKKEKGTVQDMENREVLQEDALESTEAMEAIDAAGSELEAVTAEGADVEADDAQAQTEKAKAGLIHALEEAQAKQEEYLNLAQRVQADFENFRRRNQGVRKEAFDDGARNFAVTMLPVLDNIERALGAAKDSADPSLREGVEMVHRQFCEVFVKHGIEPIHRLGEKFDPNLENAVMQAEPGDGEPGTVAEVLQKGYRMGDAVLRYAMVKVVPE